MKKVTLTLDLTYAEAEAVLALLNGTVSAASTEAVEAKLPAKEKVVEPVKELVTEAPMDSPAAPKKTVAKVKVKVTAGKKTMMPGFGRTQTQIDSFTADEAEKFEKKTDEQLLKEQRAEERLEAKKVKDQIAADKKAERDKAAEEVEAIKKAGTIAPVVTELPPKPWAL